MTELAQLPTDRDTRIVVGTSVRKSLPVLQAFLDSLAWQELPPKVTLIPAFVPDWPDSNDLAARYLGDWVRERNGHLLRGVPGQQGDFADTNVPSHQWTLSAMRRVGANKNRIIAKAAELRADYLWLVDADLMLDRTTLWSLLHAGLPIVCGVYWTRWHKAQGEAVPLPASPQAWLRHPYELSGRGLEEAEFRTKLAAKELTQVWGQGANTLIRHEIWEAGIGFDPVPGVSQEGLMAGEDRQFCIQAERKHKPMWADPWPDVFHLYHLPDDLERVPVMATRLGAVHPVTPAIGDAVSLMLQAVEPVQQPNGQWVQAGTQPVRGRLGTLPLLPELEAALLEMRRGETRIVPAHCPLHHPIPVYRGRRRLFRVTLVDCKAWGYPPVLEDDMTVAGAKALLTLEQVRAVV